MDKSNDMKQLKEQIRKLDEHLDCEMQVKFTQFCGHVATHNSLIHHMHTD